MTNKNLAR